MRTNFAKKTISVSNYYKCQCGNNFTRKVSDWYTMSPLNPMSESECRATIADRLMRKEKTCPKCKVIVNPVI